MTVAEPVSDTDQIEIVCPDVVNPGEYFLCVADIPRGSGLTLRVEMTDDIDATSDTVSQEMAVPGGGRFNRSC